MVGSNSAPNPLANIRIEKALRAVAARKAFGLEVRRRNAQRKKTLPGNGAV